MKLLVFASSAATLMLAQVAEAASPVINSAYALKDLTLSGVLLVAVVYLYRELGRERKKTEDIATESKAFIVTQSEAVRQAADAQGAALGEVAQALTKQQAALDTFIAIQRDHINRILDHVTKKNSDTS